jgi:predicted transcriptional regulator
MEKRPAWTEEDEFFDPEYLKSHDRGTAIHLEKSAHKTAPLKVIPEPADQP